MQSTAVVVSCLLFAFASAQPPCRPCDPNRCNNAGLDCPGGIVYDNEVCPCCYQCAQQVGEECTPQEAQDNPVVAYFYCDEGLVCESLPRQTSPPFGDAQGICRGTPKRSCPFGASFGKGCMNCTCADGETDCEYNEGQYELCPDPHELPDCPNGAPRKVTPEACCWVCPFSCPGGGVCEDEPPTLAKPPPESVTATTGNPFSFSFDVSGMGVFYKIAEPKKDAVLTVTKIQISGQGAVIFRDRVTVTGSTEGCYVIKYWNNEEVVFNVTVCVEYKKQSAFVGCDFEENMCGMTSQSKAGIAWKRGSGPAGSMTGPSTGNDGSEYYSFLDSSYPAREGNFAYFCTPKIKSPPCLTFSFAYHMYGEDVGRLRVRQIIYGKRSAKHYIFSKKGNQGNRWKTVRAETKPIGLGTSTKFCFDGRIGGGSRGDIAIDNIAINGMQCPTPTPITAQKYN